MLVDRHVDMWLDDRDGVEAHEERQVSPALWTNPSEMPLLAIGWSPLMQQPRYWTSLKAICSGVTSKVLQHTKSEQFTSVHFSPQWP